MDSVPLSRVYCPASQRVDDWDRCRALLEDVAAASWITGGPGVPDVTLLPTMWRGPLLLAHASAHNAQFDLPEGDPVACRVVVQGPRPPRGRRGGRSPAAAPRGTRPSRPLT